MPSEINSVAKPIVFYLITLVLAVLVRLLVPYVGEASLPLTMLTPAVGAVLMLTVVMPESGFRRALTSLGLDKAGFKGWSLAVGGPVLIFALELVLMAQVGLTSIAWPEITGSVSFAILDIFAGLFIGTFFAAFEEIGWRGYMLPRLARFPLVPVMLVVGFFHGIWHLPLMLTTDYYHTGNLFVVVPLFLVTLTLAGIFYGFLRVWTGSVWPVAIAHAVVNTGWNLSQKLSTANTPAVLEYIGGESGVIMIVGLLLFDCVIIYYLTRHKIVA